MTKQDAEDTLQRADAALAKAAPLLGEAERRLTERRGPGRPPTGRRAMDRPANAWSTGQLAYCVGMTTWFVVKEIEAGELTASRIGTEYRIHWTEVRRYLESKRFPVPDWMRAA